MDGGAGEAGPTRPPHGGGGPGASMAMQLSGLPRDGRGSAPSKVKNGANLLVFPSKGTESRGTCKMRHEWRMSCFALGFDMGDHDCETAKVAVSITTAPDPGLILDNG